MDWLFLFVVSGIIYALIMFSFYWFDDDDVETDNSMIGRQVVVTGANCGIGRQVALSLASKGASVILGCRSIEKGQKAADRIISITGNKDVVVKHIDLEDFGSIRKFVEGIDYCHCLINNAGLMLSEPQSKDGMELTMCTNHLGPFLLTNLLLPVLKKTSKADDTECRIVFVGSKLASKAELEVSDVQSGRWLHLSPGIYDKWMAYRNSKLCNLLTVNELNRRLGVQLRTGGDFEVTVNVVSPGMVNTKFMRFMPRWQQILSSPLRALFLRSPKQGADSVIYAASSDELNGVSGVFISKRQIIPTPKRADNLVLAKAVWDQSSKIVKLKTS